MTEARRYRTIVIDPPWPGPGEVPAFDARVSGPMKLNLIPYSTMTGIQVAALNVPEIAADDGQLFIWATSRSVADAFLLAQLWAFKFRTLFIWEKPGLGLGRHARNQAEFLLWAGRRGAKLVEPKDCPHQIQRWPKPKRHSEKPAEAYELIRRLSDGPRLDIFARQRREGFEPWGNQVPDGG
jgi:N6-adenosine-specific RNA methylase IME4